MANSDKPVLEDFDERQRTQRLKSISQGKKRHIGTEDLELTSSFKDLTDAGRNSNKRNSLLLNDTDSSVNAKTKSFMSRRLTADQ